MTDVAIRCEALGKRYHIGAAPLQYRTLRDSLVGVVARPIMRIRHPGAVTRRTAELWALRGVTFEVQSGEAVGIIGRNGTGKSTLLKLLGRVTQPTEGRLGFRGRLGSLLEVGTGFHPELTGRENIYLNGAILGMTRVEIKRRFDEIVAFAEVERFLDTPVKRYSSGMYVRLAFAVAAHLESEILLVDEVLSVGDIAFQKRCLGKMEDVAGEGRTVLFVSHNMPAIRSLCTRALRLDVGQVAADGPADAVVDEYLKLESAKTSVMEWSAGQGPGDDDARLVAVRVLDEAGRPADVVVASKPFSVDMELDVGRLDDALCVGFDLGTADGAVVLRSYHTDGAPEEWPPVSLGRNRLRCRFPGGLLNDGQYSVLPRVSLHCVRWIVHSETAVSFEVHRDSPLSPYALTPRPGTVAPTLTWYAEDAYCDGGADGP
jgi:lipopolysaccharide transport system ATP-binding protein